MTQPAIDVFLASKQESGLINGIDYWQVANGYTAIALHDSWSNTTTNLDVLDDLIAKIQANKQDCINEMNDDSMWWSMCLLEMFELSGNTQRLQVARNIWAHVNQYVIPPHKYIVNGVDMEGGVIWSSKQNETEVNSITTGLYSELSARLACIQSDLASRQKLLLFAIHSLSWILRCQFDRDEYLVLDHIDLQTGENFTWTFTYNTGQAIAASIAIYSAMKDTPLLAVPPSSSTNSSTSIPPPDADTYLDLACSMATKAMTRIPSWVAENGTLTEPGAYPGTPPNAKQAWQNDDAVGFKAILVRSLAKLYVVLARDHDRDARRPDVQSQLAAFVEQQFASLRLRNNNGQNQYGPWWNGPMDLPTSHSQMAVMDVMAAVHAVRIGAGAQASSSSS